MPTLTNAQPPSTYTDTPPVPPHPHHSLVSICITTHHTNPSYIHTIHTLSHHITLTPLPQEAKRLLVELELRAATTQLNLVSLQSALAAAEATKGVDEDAVKAAEVAVQQLVRSCHTITRCATVKFEVTRRVTLHCITMSRHSERRPPTTISVYSDHHYHHHHHYHHLHHHHHHLHQPHYPQHHRLHRPHRLHRLRRDRTCGGRQSSPSSTRTATWSLGSTTAGSQ